MLLALPQQRLVTFHPVCILRIDSIQGNCGLGELVLAIKHFSEHDFGVRIIRFEEQSRALTTFAQVQVDCPA